MIITVTCNPAIDKTISDDSVVFDVGGKGINVSKVLKNLDIDSICTGFIGKENKKIVLDKLDELNIKHHFIEIDGRVRTNIKKIIDNELFEENEKGPGPDEDDVNNLFNYLKGFKNEIVIISGSCNVNIYYDLVQLLKDNNNYVILDADEDLLVEGIKACPDVIKPNKEEICRLFKIEYKEELIIEKCKTLNIDLVCVSLGEDGVLFINRANVYKAAALDVKYGSAVGAGDSVVASLAYSRVHSLDIIDAVKLAVSCSAASVETKGTMPPGKKEVFDKFERVKVELIKSVPSKA